MGLYTRVEQDIYYLVCNFKTYFDKFIYFNYVILNIREHFAITADSVTQFIFLVCEFLHNSSQNICSGNQPLLLEATTA